MSLNIISSFLKNTAAKEINLDRSTKAMFAENPKLNSFESYCNDLTSNEKLDLFRNIELQLLLSLRDDVLPRFVRSSNWQQFVIDNLTAANECCDKEDIEKVNKLKLKREDFARERITRKDFNFCELVAGDMSCFQCILQNDILIFFSKGEQFVDEKDVGCGQFNMQKTVALLPFSAEVVLASQLSPEFNKKVMPTTLYDVNELGKKSHT